MPLNSRRTEEKSYLCNGFKLQGDAHLLLEDAFSASEDFSYARSVGVN